MLELMLANVKRFFYPHTPFPSCCGGTCWRRSFRGGLRLDNHCKGSGSVLSSDLDFLYHFAFKILTSFRTLTSFKALTYFKILTSFRISIPIIIWDGSRFLPTKIFILRSVSGLLNCVCQLEIVSIRHKADQRAQRLLIELYSRLGEAMPKKLDFLILLFFSVGDFHHHTGPFGAFGFYANFFDDGERIVVGWIGSTSYLINIR